MWGLDPLHKIREFLSYIRTPHVGMDLYREAIGYRVLSDGDRISLLDDNEFLRDELRVVRQRFAMMKQVADSSRKRTDALVEANYLLMEKLKKLKGD